MAPAALLNDVSTGSLIPGTVIDAGGSKVSSFMRAMLEERLLWSDGPYSPAGVPQRLLPSPLLSDKTGLEIWEKINRLPTYYQTDGEIELIRRRGAEIAAYIQPHTVLVDLGCGDIRKAKPLLDELERLQKPAFYFALDLCKDSLTRGMKEIGTAYEHIQCFGLWADFYAGLDFLNASDIAGPRLYLSLGSIFGNDHLTRAVDHLCAWKAKAFIGSADAMLLTMDGTTEAKKIWESYHDDAGLFEQFIRNGCRHSNDVLGCEWYRDDDWEHKAILQQDPDVHIFVLQAKRAVDCQQLDLHFAAGDTIDCYEGFKYGPEMMRRQFAEAGLEERACWKAPSHSLYQYLVAPSRGCSPPMLGLGAV